MNLYGYDEPFGASISLERVFEPNSNIILCYKMNDNILTLDHGYPLRIIIPGYSGAKQIKWLKKIEISDKEIDCAWQKGIAYKKLPNFY